MYLGGIDVGTTGCKIVVYDEKADLKGTYYQEYPTAYANGKHEINFANIRDGILQLLAKAEEEYPLSVLGITTFGETFAMLDEEDNILLPSMLYTDPRGTEECAWLKEQLGEEKITRISGVRPHAMYSIFKIMWQKKHHPEEFSRCKRILLAQDFVGYILTGTAQIDYSSAARTGAFDVQKMCWSEEIFAAAGVDTALLSKPVPTGTVAGSLRQELKTRLGISHDITVITCCQDQIAAMIGSGVFNGDCAMDGTGTVECIPVVLEKFPEQSEIFGGGYSVVPYLNGKYACYAFSFTGGASLKWFRDRFAELEMEQAKKQEKNVYALLDQRVKDEPTGILVLPHFAGAATPYMDPDSKAAFVGITMETDKIDLYRALMEGTSYEILMNLSRLEQYTGKIQLLRATGGGASSDLWLQIKADILNCNIVALSCSEVGAAGTAALCGKVMGVYDSLEDTVRKMAPERKTFCPNAEMHEKYQQIFAKYQHLYIALKGL